MASEFDLPVDDKGMTKLAGYHNVLWRYGQDGLSGRKPHIWQSDLKNWLAQINQDPPLWHRYGSGKDTARHLATGMGEVILAAAAIKSDSDWRPFCVHLNAAIAAYSEAHGVPPALPFDSLKELSRTWDLDRALPDRLRLVDQYLNELERPLSSQGREALGMVRSVLSDLVESEKNRILLGRLKFQVRCPVAVVLEGEGAAKGVGRAFLLTVEWFDRLEGNALLVRNPVALGCSVLDEQFGQAERAAWAVAVEQTQFRKGGFVRWGTDMEPGPQVVAIGGPSAGGALATTLVSAGKERQPVRALVLGRLTRKEGEKTTKSTAGKLYEVGGVADKAIAAASSENLRVGRLVLWQPERGTNDAPEIRDDIEYLQQEHKNLKIERFQTVLEVVEHLTNRRTVISDYLRTHPRIMRVCGLVMLLLLLATSIGTWAHFDAKKKAIQIADLVREYDAEVDQEDWPLDQMNTCLEALAQYDVEIANVNWIKFADKVRYKIESNPHLKKDEVNRYEVAVGFLEKHDKGLAESVRAVLEPRLTHLQLQWELPHDDYQKVFSPQTVTVENGLQVLVKSKKDTLATRIVTLERCGPGGAQLEVKCDDSWLDVSRLELELNATEEKSGYTFTLRTVKNGPMGGRQTFREAHSSKGEKIELGIGRNNIPLHIENLDAGLLADDTLTMTATREGSILTLQVGDLQPLVFEDIFALSSKESEAGHFAILWPKEVRLLTLKAHVILKQQKLSPLEDGDKSYAEGKFADALKAYKDHAQRVNKPDVDQEIRYKLGLCLIALGENEQAKEVFKKLGDEKGEIWPLYACVQLWNLYILHDEMRLADELFDDHIKRHKLDISTLVRHIPDKTRRHILKKYRDVVEVLQGQKITHLERINAAGRWVAVEEVMNGDAIVESKIWLGLAFYLGNNPEKAIEVMRSLHQQSPSFYLLGRYVWILRKTGSLDEALKVVKEAEEKHKGSDLLFFALLRAECTPVAKWNQVEEELTKKVRGSDSLRDLCCAWLMIGFIRESRKDYSGAEMAWREACKCAEKPTDRGDLLCFLISRSLAGVSNKTDAEEFLKRASNAHPDTALAAITNLIPRLLGEDSLVKVAGEMWRTREGRDLARQLVFREVSFSEQFTKPPTLAIFEYARQHALGYSQDPQQLKICWQVAESIFHHAVEDPNRELINLGLLALPAWKGKDVSIAIKTLIMALPQSDRGPTAYVAAHRMLQLQKFDDALKFFEISSKNAQENNQSSLAELIKCDRKLFEGNKGRLIVHSDGRAKIQLILHGDKGVINKEFSDNENLELEVGHYKIELGKDANDVASFPPEVNITCCGRATIHIKQR